jgi:hypothetical protein
MSVWIYVIVECDNPAVIKECVAALKDSDADKCTGWKDGDTRIKVEMNAFDIHFDIEKVSKCFPNDVITCVYGYDNTPGDSYTSEYRNGERIHHSVRAAYHFLRMPLTNEEDVAKIYEKTGTFFHRLDTPVTDQNGRTRIDWVEEDIIYKFYFDAADGKQYRVEAAKQQGHVIKFKVYEDVGKDDWREISRPKNIGSAECPF